MKLSNIDLNDYKMIVSDIDGTLMGKDHIIHDLTKEVVFRLRDRGIYFTLATGKNLPATVSQADTLEIDLPLILINGAMLQTRQGKVLEQSVLPVDVTCEFVEIGESQGRDLVMYINEDILVREVNENIENVYGSVRSGMTEVGDWGLIRARLPDVNKCLVVDSINRENLINIGKDFEGAFGDRADIVHASLSLVEVMPKGITKAVGIKKLADALNVDLGEVIAFGDFDNDIEMLASAGLGLAVENASPGAKAAARFVIGSVDVEGPAAFLQKILDR